MWRFPASYALAGAIVLASLGQVCAAVPTVYLVQTSGWMEPFYEDQNSPLKELVGALIDTTWNGAVITIAGFNQNGQVPGHQSPEPVYSGEYNKAAVQQAVNSLHVERKANGALADADFNGALEGGIKTLLGGKTGILWFVTNNKNSPYNSQEVVRNTRAFAEALRNSEVLPYLVAYPLHIPVRGKLYSETGLIIYGIAYGTEAAAELKELVNQAPMRQLFTDPPVQLKQLDHAPLVFTPQTVSPSTVTAVPLANGGFSIRDVPGDGVTLLVHGTLQSDYYPQVIEEAQVSLRWDSLEGTGGSNSLSAAIEPTRLHRLAPLEILEDVNLAITVPPLPRPPGLAGLFANTATFDGALVVELTAVRMSLQDEFSRKLAQITALDQLPDVFLDYRRLTAASTRLPIRIEARFSIWPLLLALAALVALLAFLLALGYFLLRNRGYTVAVDGRRKRFDLRPFQSIDQPTANGDRMRIRGTLFGAARVTHMPPPPGAAARTR